MEMCKSEAGEAPGKNCWVVRTFAHKHDAGPQAWVTRSETDEDAAGACLFQAGAVVEIMCSND
jgi:hypothetical protein